MYDVAIYYEEKVLHDFELRVFISGQSRI